MTVLLKDPNAISNYFNDLVKDLGHRGSTFMDIDAVTHDREGDRFLIQEFKQPGEPVNKAQRETLNALTTLPRVQVWIIQRTQNRFVVEMTVCPHGRPEEVSVNIYRQRYARWWDCEAAIAG